MGNNCEQTDLFKRPRRGGPKLSLDERFAAYHKVNPQIFELFEKYTFELKKAGVDHFGAKAIMELIRFHVVTTTLDPKGFKINNNFTSRYVRLLVAKWSQLDGFFETRGLKS